MYEIKAPSSVKKDIKRLDKPVQRELRDKYFPKIKESPFDAEPLRGDLRGLWAYHFFHGSTQYRIVYEILRDERVVMLVMVGSRGDFYESLRRRLRLW
jgi:addiction module RelE/StbE family toxin